MRRRTFLGVFVRSAALSAAITALPPWVRRASAAGPTPDFIERNDQPEHWETTLAALGRSSITPNDRFFVRSHFPVPEVDPGAWSLEVAGLVRKPFRLSFDEVRALGSYEATHTLECAGNGRGLFALPSTSGTQWEYGAVGNARWTGVRLATLIERAEVA